MGKRKAIDCKLLRPSNSHPGFFKYEVTVRYPDGTEKKYPAYGKDMQDAIARLVWNQRVDKVSTRLKPWHFLVGWFTLLLGPGLMSGYEDSPKYLISALVTLAVFISVAFAIDKYVKDRD